MKTYSDLVRLRMTVNGEERSLTVRPSDTLLRALRETLGLTGTKVGCENGDCGACTVLADGVPVKSCYLLAVDMSDREIVTIEGLSASPVQQAFVEEYGFQCGYCTPGFIMNAEGLLRAHRDPDEETIRAWMESNLCRCTGYETIERAVKRAIRERE